MLKDILPTPAEAPDEATPRQAKRRGARRQMSEPEEQQEWPGATDGEPIPFDDPLADW